MAKKSKKLVSFAVAAVLTVSSASGLIALTGCKPNEDDKPTGLKQGTFRTYTSTMPSNWNVFTSQDANDSKIMNYIESNFYEYDYVFEGGKKFNDDGTINAEAIVDGEFEVKYSAATKLEDVTDTVPAKWGYTDAQKASGGYAYRITLRDDLCWDDGTEIHAEDFVYSMKEQLNPDFMHYRASEFYGQVHIKNSRYYVYGKTPETYETLGSQGYEGTGTIESAVSEAVAAGETVYLDMWGFYGLEGALTEDGSATCPQWVSIADETVYIDPADNSKVTAKEIFEMYSGSGYFDASCFSLKVSNAHLGFSFDDVGMYVDSENSFVICLENPISFIKDDGSLSYQAAYYMANLPLVKKDLYEASKKEPVAGSSLWTTDYNTTLAKSASWGPYKLAEFSLDKSFKLVRNDKWYGYKLEDNKNQYNVTAIETELIETVDTIWQKFLKGETDEAGIDVTRKDDYRNSKYAVFQAATGTTGVQFLGDLTKLKAGGRNNTILAIPEFRKAVSLAIDRDDYNTRLSTSNRACLGVLNSMYYYDVENGGVYRNTPQAKKTLLRAYGFTENTDGTWTNGTLNNLSMDDAYEALTGYDLTQAKALLMQAYEKLTTDDSYAYDSTKPIKIVFGSSVVNEVTTRYETYFKELFATLTEGTPLEGKIEVSLDGSFGDQWATAFRSGAYDLCTGGFQNAPFNPGYMIGAHIQESSTYHPYWDNEHNTVSLTMPAGTFEGAGQTFAEFPVLNLYRCLNGQATPTDKYKFNWSSGFIPEDARLEVIAVIEEYILESYYFMPTTAAYTAAMLGKKFTYVNETYNTFMGFGGYRYMIVNYSDAEWNSYVAEVGVDGLTAEYKKSA